MERLSLKQQLEQARTLESEGQLSGAAKAYLRVLKADPLLAAAYSRLMIIYRKQKEYSKELAIIRKAIKAFEDDGQAKQQEWAKEHRAAARISRLLAKSLGMLNRSGQPLQEDKMLDSWRKRKLIVSGKIK